jgi:hypothetical protein
VEPIKLTARQIKYFGEISIDKQAAKLTLDVALAHHSNQVNEISKREAELWDELAELHNLDKSVRYETAVVDGCMVIKIAEK